MSHPEAITEGDARYGTLLGGFNQRWPSAREQRARRIYLCATEQEVLDAVRAALRDPSLVPAPGQRDTPASRTGKRITVRSGGHAYEGFVSDNPGGVILDLGPLSGFDADVVLDPGRYEAARGVELGDGRTVDVAPPLPPPASSPLPATPPAPAGPDADRQAHAPHGRRYRYRLRPGTGNWDGCLAMYKTAGVTLPGGSCYSVGAGGHICGGGYGLLSRMHGLTTDHLAGVDVVLVPDGRNPVLVHASPQLNPELFRLCRGAGGGTIGIITAYYFDRLPAPPRDAVLLFLTVPWAQFLGAGGRERFAAWLGRYGEHFRRIQDDPRSDGLFTLLHVTHRSTDMALTVQFCAREGDLPPGRNVATEAERVLRHLLDAVFLAPGAEGAVEYEPASASFGVGHAIVSEPATVSSRAYARDLKVPGAVVMNWLDAVQYLDGSGANQRGKYKSAYLKDVPAAYAEGLYDALTSPPEELLGDELPEEGLPEGFDTTSLIVQMDSYGGTINRWANDADAVWQRDSQVKVQYQVYWHDPEQDPLYLAWLRRVYAAGFGGSAGPGLPWDPEGAHYQGCYINYPDVDMLEATPGGGGGAGGEAGDGADGPAAPATPASWLELYFGPDLPARLVAAKAAYDPHDVFRHAMSIPTREPGC